MPIVIGVSSVFVGFIFIPFPCIDGFEFLAWVHQNLSILNFKLYWIYVDFLSLLTMASAEILKIMEILIFL